MFIFNNFWTWFGHHYAHLQENETYVTVCGVLRWFCWMWLVAVEGRCVVGCEHCRTVTFTVLAPHKAAPHNRYQQHPAEPAQHTTCSNIRFVLLKMGIMMPETCWEIVENKHLTVASCWFSLSLLNLLTMHGHRNLKHLYWVLNINRSHFDRTVKSLSILDSQNRSLFIDMTRNFATCAESHGLGSICFF